MSVFISYRRKGGSRVARKIYRALSADYEVFMDEKSLKSGFFSTALINEVKQCTDFVLIVTKTTFDHCKDPDDWITKELNAAASENKTIIPIFVGVKKFPDNVPDNIRQLKNGNFCNLQGIEWKRGALNKIKSYLKSNRRLVLSVVRKDWEPKLSEKSKQDLLALYMRFHDQGRRPVDVRLELQDENNLAEAILPKLQKQGIEGDFAVSEARQELKRRIHNCKATLEIAIEDLLQDKMIDICALDVVRDYVKRYGANHCQGINENGLKVDYWTPFTWFDIIEELLKELICYRPMEHANDKTYMAIQCYASIKDKDAPSSPLSPFPIKETVIWQFSSILPKKTVEEVPPITSNYTEDKNPNCWDVPAKERIQYIYPDFYYNIALIKQGRGKTKLKEIEHIEGCFNLYYYRFC